MNETMFKRLTELLETTPDFYVPIKKLWHQMEEEGLAGGIDLDTFHSQLAADERFEIVEGVVQDPDLAERERDLEEMGFFGGPRVKLTSRQITTDDVLSGLSRSLEQLNEALRGAWDSRPEGDEETEGLLLDALSMAEQLEREVHSVIQEQLDELDGEDEDK